MLSDIQIAQQSEIQPISQIAAQLNLLPDEWLAYGEHAAKLDFVQIQKRLANQQKGSLVLVTAISPTPSGEGKTTVTIGLTQALHLLKQRVLACLREPSLGPVFGRKGGATGGGYAQIIPMTEINLHFNGDIHAITTANNLISAMIDNHIYQGNSLNIDPNRIVWKRCLDMNDRSLRTCQIIIDKNGKTRVEKFQISVASEIMAVICLSKDYQDLKSRLSTLIVAYDMEGKMITPNDLGIVGSLCTLLQQALKPNLVQTLNHAPVLVHGGPFANIAHGCSSVIATELGLRLADFVVTEAGFGADLGGEKFLDIKCRQNDLRPNVVILVTTLKALYYQNEANQSGLNLAHLDKHLQLLKSYGLPILVAGNLFAEDQKEEWQIVENHLNRLGIDFAPVTAFKDGAEGAVSLAIKVISSVNKQLSDKSRIKLNHPYEVSDSLANKMTKLAQKIYGAQDVHYSEEVKQKLLEYEKLGYGNLPICVAKTPYSFTDDPRILGAPENFTLKITDVDLAAGAGFVLFYAGDITTMPGLPKNPAATKISFNPETLEIQGLF